MKARHWKEIPERGSVWGIALLRRIMLVGGLPAMRIMLAPVVLYYLLTHSTARAASRDYVSRLNAYCAMHDRECVLRSGLWSSYRHIYSFALSMAEKHAAWNGTYTKARTVHIHDPAVSRRFMRRDEGVVLLASHLGNFDIAIAFGAFDTDRRFRVLIDHTGMQRFNQLRFSTMQHDRVVFHDAGNVGPETAVELREAIADGDVVVLAADRLNDPGDESVDVRLLGGEAAVPVGPWVMAHLLRCPVYAVFACRDGGSYQMIPFHICERVELGPRGSRRERIREHAQTFVNCMEQVMLRYPEQWYNFYQYWHEE